MRGRVIFRFIQRNTANVDKSFANWQFGKFGKCRSRVRIWKLVLFHETVLFPPGFHAMSSSVALTLNPVPGFCVKSIALQPAVVHRTATSHPLSTPSDTTGASSNTIPKGLKVFVNIAWDTNVPPPPPASEDAIQKAMLGRDYDESNSDGWFIPVIVSDLRDDKDKGRCCPLPVSEHFAQAHFRSSHLIMVSLSTLYSRKSGSRH